MKPLRIVVFLCSHKNQLIFCPELAERSNCSFSVYLYVSMERMELNSLCKPMKKVRSSQASIAINSCTELSKTPIFPVTIFKRKFKLTSPKRNISKKSEKMARWKKLHINFISKKYYTLTLNHEVYNGSLQSAIIFLFNQLYSYILLLARTKTVQNFQKKIPRSSSVAECNFHKMILW